MSSEGLNNSSVPSGQLEKATYGDYENCIIEEHHIFLWDFFHALRILYMLFLEVFILSDLTF